VFYHDLNLPIYFGKSVSIIVPEDGHED